MPRTPVFPRICFLRPACSPLGCGSIPRPRLRLLHVKTRRQAFSLRGKRKHLEMLSASRNHLTRCLRTAVAARQVSVRQFHPSASRLGGSITRHEVWRDDNEQDNLPKVKRRDGSIAAIEKKRGFVDYHRNPDPYRDPLDRVFDWGEIKTDEGHDEVERKVQAARCMDCGTPFCQTHTGCPGGDRPAAQDQQLP
ncbi:glutamate synthase [Nannochloropsis gaditana]|uniref:Glutamate synthase n=1 Tax=Nannochloropsis gaditana TaxID=72520 RepID=W7U2F2_9STRA|nr:glutamate synthase [Nannochloropsis gaditana]